MGFFLKNSCITFSNKILLIISSEYFSKNSEYSPSAVSISADFAGCSAVYFSAQKTLSSVWKIPFNEDFSIIFRTPVNFIPRHVDFSKRNPHPMEFILRYKNRSVQFFPHSAVMSSPINRTWEILTVLVNEFAKFLPTIWTGSLQLHISYTK